MRLSIEIYCNNTPRYVGFDGGRYCVLHGSMFQILAVDVALFGLILHRSVTANCK